MIFVHHHLSYSHELVSLHSHPSSSNEDKSFTLDLPIGKEAASIGDLIANRFKNGEKLERTCTSCSCSTAVVTRTVIIRA